MAAAAVRSEFELTSEEFEQLASYIQYCSGIKTPPSKQLMVEGRLRRRARELGLNSVIEYFQFIFDENGMYLESTHLIDAVTTNKTDFFREIPHFHYLNDTVFPGYLADPHWDRTVKVWSAASSIGAEPYTLAMVLADFAGANPGVQVSVEATDLSTRVLESAVRAVYPEEMVAPVPMDMRKRYLLRSKQSARQEVRIVEPLRKMVQFKQLNLMDRQYSLRSDFDIIFCRNVLIYFEKLAQTKVVERMLRHLKPGGYLFLGHTEVSAAVGLPLTCLSGSVFRYDGR